jgi:branched-chain amino acid aminotransferase
MHECTGRYFYQNFTCKDITLFNPDLLLSGNILYEVLRVQEGTGLFLEDHIARLYESIRISGLTFEFEPQQIKVLINSLISSNHQLTGNIKIVVTSQYFNLSEITAYYTPHFYPSATMYKNGVDTSFFKATRITPNLKMLRTDFRETLIKFIHSKKIYEAILVTENDQVTEGSKSNLFFISQNKIFTPPENIVLKGITRGKIIYICKQLNYSVIEEPIYKNSLNDFEAVFLTGTSPKVLPIRTIDQYKFTAEHKIIKSISLVYDEMITSYIREAKMTI